MKFDINVCTIWNTYSECGSCYGAKDNGCCNTCSEVKEAYDAKNWNYGDFTQCGGKCNIHSWLAQMF